MTPYANRNNSGVDAYDIFEDEIHVRFGNDTYVYTDASVGRTDLEAMKELAEAGSGLNSFISKHVKKNYARKY